MNSHLRVLRRLENIVAVHRLRKSPPLQAPYFHRAHRRKQLSTVYRLAHLPPLPKSPSRKAWTFIFFKENSRGGNGLSPEGSPTARKYSLPFADHFDNIARLRST